jgi:hypothetical protein
MKCCLCGEEIKPTITGWTEGNNAMPLKDGRCCSYCNYTKVLPERIRRIKDAK